MTYFDFPTDFCLCMWLFFYKENSVQKIKAPIFITVVFLTAPKMMIDICILTALAEGSS